MREHKYRAWHPGITVDNKQVFKSHMYYDEWPGQCLLHKRQGQPLRVMESIGLTDVNNSEIYECDILEDEREQKYIVRIGKYNNMICVYLESPGSTWRTHMLDSVPKFRIIGNTCENPELI